MIDVYAYTTPNGFKALFGIEEFGLPYKLNWIDITKGVQMTPEYLAINPNNKIPAIRDSEGPDGKPITIFESGAVLLYLADKTGKLLAKSGADRYIALEWVFFNAGGPGPMLGQLGYFTKFAQEKVPAAIERFTKEGERLLRVLDKRLGEVPYLAGAEFTIADIMNVTWPRAARDFIGMDMTPYPNVTRWIAEIEKRPAAQKAFAMKPTPS
jgi:GST-like protein